MKKGAVILVLLCAVGIAALGLIGVGINGMLTFDETVKPLCTTNVDCVSPEVCCYFYQQEAGVCNSNDLCARILEITRDEKINRQLIPILMSPRNEGIIHNAEIFIGAVIFFASAVTIYLFATPDRIKAVKKAGAGKTRN